MKVRNISEVVLKEQAVAVPAGGKVGVFCFTFFTFLSIVFGF